ncbi:MAG: 4Fe-4S binding protein [Candidatus Bathyarchaeia archaeon]
MCSNWINHNLCTGCGTCVKICPADVIRIDENTKRAIIKYSEDCFGCQLCKVHCPQGAIQMTPKRHMMYPPPLGWR